MTYSYSDLNEIKNALSKDYFHDGKICDFNYNNKNKSLSLSLENTYLNKKIFIQVAGVVSLLSTGFNPWNADDDTHINCISADTSNVLLEMLLKIQPYSNKIISELWDKLLVLSFQFFSGNELYIVCKEVDITKAE